MQPAALPARCGCCLVEVFPTPPTPAALGRSYLTFCAKCRRVMRMLLRLDLVGTSVDACLIVSLRVCCCLGVSCCCSAAAMTRRTHMGDEETGWADVLRGEGFPGNGTRLNVLARLMVQNGYTSLRQLRFAPRNPCSWLHGGVPGIVNAEARGAKLPGAETE